MFHRRAQDCIGHAARRPERYVKGQYPTHLKRGHGCWVWDHDGKKYMDFISGQGTSLLGYANTQINAAMAAQAELGVDLSLSTTAEIEAAEKLKELFSFVESVMFFKSGVEALAAAAEIGVTLSGQAPVIVQPVGTDMSDERIAWLREAKSRCVISKTLLVFDETETGFRFPKYSVANFANIKPDLIILGGAMGSGMPIAAVGGRFSVMNGNHAASSAQAGESLSLVAARKTMELLQTRHDVDVLWKQGQAFLDEFNSVYPEKIKLVGYPTRAEFQGDPLIRALFWQEACVAGMLFGPVVYFNFPLAAEAPNAMGAIKAILGRIKRGEVSLKGQMPQ